LWVLHNKQDRIGKREKEEKEEKRDNAKEDYERIESNSLFASST
jgi:hypothetical protein